MGGAGSKRLAIRIAAAAHVLNSDRSERHEFNGDDLNECSGNRIATADPHLRAPP